MHDRNELIASFEGRIWENEMYKGGYIHVPQEEAETILELLKERETTLEKDGHHIRCLNCGEYWCDNDREGNPFPMNFCPNCGRKVKWND